jgi:branched-chain amino acid transport system permease protein
MAELVRISFDTLSFVSVLVLLVLGLAVVVSMMGIFNLAQGEFVLLGGLVVFQIGAWGWPLWTGIVLAPLFVAAVGLVLERTVIRRFYARPVAALLGTWALSLVIREAVRAYLGGVAQAVPKPVTGSITVAGADLSLWRLIIIGATIGALLGVYLFLSRTRFGLVIRATLDNPLLAGSSGVPTARIYAGTFAFGAALSGIAGAFIVPLQALYPELGLDFLSQSFLAVMVGGTGSFIAPVIGATLIGVPMGLLPFFVSAVIAEPLVFLVAIVVMRLKPQGLFGRGHNWL